jgi:hypothetical protein
MEVEKLRNDSWGRGEVSRGIILALQTLAKKPGKEREREREGSDVFLLSTSGDLIKGAGERAGRAQFSSSI